MLVMGRVGLDYGRVRWLNVRVWVRASVSIVH